MADTKVSALPAAGTLDGSEEFPVNKGGSKKATTRDAANLGQALALNTQTASYQLVLTDRDKRVEMDVAGANNLTVPANATVAFPIGTTIPISQRGAGRTTIVAAGGVTIRTKSTLIMQGQYTHAFLRKRATDEWVLFGELLGSVKSELSFACSDRTTAITAGAGKGSRMAPWDFYVVEAMASLEGAAQASGSIFTVNVKDDAVSIFTTKITIDNTEYSSLTAAAPPVLTSTPLLIAKGSKIEADVDQVGDGTAKGLIVYLRGYEG